MNLEIGNNRKTWNAVCALALVLMLVIALADMFVPKPTEAKEKQNRHQQVNELERKIKTDEDYLQELILAETGTWEGDQEVVTPKILQTVSQLASSHNVNLKSFRPQSPVSDGDTIRAHFVILADGKFPDMASFMKALESNSTKIGTNVVQIASADQESDMVNATIGIVAYIKAPEVVATNRRPSNTNTVKPRPANNTDTTNSEEKSNGTKE
ncbi:MAG: hypothetical protein KF836_11025 [Fimbriimonadaceae bacterium]|nr:hypothetical protein [Fimbriimonadaceae bacterium]